MANSERYLIEEALTWLSSQTTNSYRTKKEYRRLLVIFFTWLEEKRGDLSIFAVGRDELDDYIDTYVVRGASQGRISIAVLAIKAVFRYLETKRLHIGHDKWWPTQLPGHKAQPSIRTVPNFHQIMAIRHHIATKLELTTATVFECLLSSGLRREEFVQLKVKDINFQPDLIDNSLGFASPYIGASARLDPRFIRTKKMRYRQVYFSKLATKLMIKYMHALGITNQPDSYLFPWTGKAVMDHIHRAGANIRNLYVENTLGLLGTINSDKTPGIDSIMPPTVAPPLTEGRQDQKRIEMFRRAQASRAARDEKKDEHYAKTEGKRMENLKLQKMLSPHCLRHTFGCMMFYRDYYGGRRDINAIKALLGHGNFGTTMLYIEQFNVLSSDREFERVMLGGMRDYFKWVRVSR